MVERRGQKYKDFSSYVKERRRKLYISEIMTDQGLLDREEQIGEATTSFYTEQFKEDNWERDDSMLQYIPNLITEEENDGMIQLPDKEEVKCCLFALNDSSTSGPDGLTGVFF